VFESQYRQEIFPFSKTARLALGPTQPPIQWPPGLFPKIEWPELSVNHSTPPSNEVRMSEGATL